MLAPAYGFHDGVQVYCTRDQDHSLDDVLDWTLLEKADPAISSRQKVEYSSPIKNTDRSVGAILSHHVVKTHGPDGLPDDTISISFTGSAGQSLGAFLAGGITMTVEGDANDYVGKGLSGGRLVVFPPKVSPFASEENILIGNVALYGATSGEAYFRGVAAERFAVRNSGALPVVEGVGDHGCEYMTCGTAVILGPVGNNFGAGMTGGVAYVFDPDERLESLSNLQTISIGRVKDDSQLQTLVTEFASKTKSQLAARMLGDWSSELSHFKLVSPIKTEVKPPLGLNRTAKRV